MAEQEDERHQLLNFKFETREDLLKGVRKFYSTRGYALSIYGSRAEKFVILKCDRGGNYRDSQGVQLSERQKTTGSRKINCSFEIKGKKTGEGLWVVEIKNLSHNHEASVDIAGHPSCRRLSAKELESVDRMSQSGIQPRQIISSLQLENPGLRAVSHTVYNAKAKIHKEKLGGRTMIEVLIQELGQGGFIYDVEHDTSGTITHLFLIHPMSITMVKNFSSIFIMDCTYKTNKYKMPLFNIIGVSCFNKTFYAGFAFLKNEKEHDFLWALSKFKKVLGEENQPSVIMSDRCQAFINAVNVIFPTTAHLLCVWHIEKNILTNCRKDFDTKEAFDTFLSMWTSTVIYSSTETEFQKNWLELQFLHSAKKTTLEYISKVIMKYFTHL